MKIIEPKVEYWPQEAGMKGVWNQIAKATRVCYQSSVREGESSEDFVKRVILKPALIEGSLDDLWHCKFDFDKMHGGMLEHGTVYITERHLLPDCDSALSNLPYTKVIKGDTIITGECEDIYYITTNLRVILEHDVKKITDKACLNGIGSFEWFTEPTEHHVKRYTFSVITDIGVTREFNRHRASMSIAEESTRYCCYNSNKFGNELTYVKSAWGCFFEDAYNNGYKTLFNDLLNDIDCGIDRQWTADEFYMFGLLASEFAYMGMRKNKEVADRCRQVLNLNTKTQAVYTAFADDWKHFLKLRADNISGKAHPNMQLIAKQIKGIIETL